MEDDRFTANAETMKLFHNHEEALQFNKDLTIHWAKMNGFDVIHEKEGSTLCEMHGESRYFEVFEDGSWEAYGMNPEGEVIDGSSAKMLQIYLKIPEIYQETMKS